MINEISNNDTINTRNRFYAISSNIVLTVALFALKEAASLDCSLFTMLGIATIATNYFIFDSIAMSTLSNKKKIVFLQITLIGLIILGNAITNVIVLSTGFHLLKMLYASIGFRIADLPLNMLILMIVPGLLTPSNILHFFKQKIIIYNRLLQELRPINLTSHEGSLARVIPVDNLRFILLLIGEAVTRDLRDGVDSNQNTIVFRQALAPHLIIHVNDSPGLTDNPSRFLDILEHLQNLSETADLQEEREIAFRTLLQEFQRLSIDLQKSYFPQILKYENLQGFIPNDLQIILQEYQGANTAIDIDGIIASGTSLGEEILQFAKKSPDLQTSYELNNIIRKYASTQNFLRENLGRQPNYSDNRSRVINCINSLYSLYQDNIVPIRFQFPDDTSVNHMDQPIWNYFTTRFSRDFFQNLPRHFFPHIGDPNKLDEDFNKYQIESVDEFITKVFNGDVTTFQTSSQEEIIEKLTNYCTNNFYSAGYKVQFLTLQQQSHRILRIFIYVIAPLLVHPVAFGVGFLLAITIPSRRRTTIPSIDNLSMSLFLQGFLLSHSSLGGVLAGNYFGSRYIVPLFSQVGISPN